jgi:RHS repeat-associated protein
VNTKNQITGDTYDAAGNLMTIPGTGGATYVFNTENQMTSTSNSSTQYIYDGDGNRVEKSGSKIYWYGGSEVLDETDITGSVTNSSFNEYIFFGGERIARRDSSNNVFYYLVDQLGSSRVIVQGGQTAFCYDADFEPFGGEHVYTNTCAQNYKFTGKERDSESNLDNFGARYYASTTGRFMTPDWALKPVTVPYASFGDPQTLNLYTYVQNSPLNRIDADGHAWASDGSGRLLPGNNTSGGLSMDGDAPTVDGNPAQFGAFYTGAAPQFAQDSAQNNDMSDKRTDVMLAATSVPPKPTSNTGTQSVMDYAIVPQANTRQELQDRQGELRYDKATQDKYSKMEVKLWESQSGGKWQWQGSRTGSGRDVLMRGPNDQRWYINDGTSTKRVQLVIGQDSNGNLIKAWTVHVVFMPTGPVYSKID